MKKQFKLGVIGCGLIAQSIIKGAILSDFLHEKKILVCDVNEKNLDNVKYLGVRTASDYREAAECCEFLLFAVKAQSFSEIAAVMKSCAPEKVISVMPDVRKNVIKNAFGISAVKVARCVPNLPCSIGSGVIGIDMSDYNNSIDDTEFISNLFNCVGTVLSIDESKMNAVSGLSGCGPAYVFMFIDSLVDAGTKQGLTKNEAKILAVQTLIGAAEMVERDELTVSELIMQTCGKGGTALEAVKIFEDKNFRGIVDAAVSACVQRSKELSEK